MIALNFLNSVSFVHNNENIVSCLRITTGKVALTPPFVEEALSSFMLSGNDGRAGSSFFWMQGERVCFS